MIRTFSPASARSFTDKTTHDAYTYVPVAYVLCEKYETLLPEWQEGRIEFLRQARREKWSHGGGGAAVRGIGEEEEVQVVRYHTTGHCPNVSDPEGCARKVIEAIGKVW